MFLIRYFLVLLQIVVTITILNVLQDYSTLELTPNKRKWDRKLPSKKHLSVLFIYVLYVGKVKIGMFMICNLRCVDAAPRHTIGNAYPSRFFLFSCFEIFSFVCRYSLQIPSAVLCVLCWIPFYFYISCLSIVHTMSHYL